MTYDPTKDEPVLSEREAKALIAEVVAHTISSMMRELRGSDIPWTTDTIYRPGTIVSHRGEPWVCLEETASEPFEGSATWDRFSKTTTEG